MIEGYNITTTQSYEIEIANVNKYFIVKNCYIQASNGIKIYNVSTVGKIIGNYCFGDHLGIFVEECDNLVFEINTCVENEDGIWFRNLLSQSLRKPK
ncbi:MAG: hypothetical protein KAS63_09880 [Candidatus Heimdallarchaeota archaeon]|nr:hypothetical protein [Candidatus Heimdallarchaeota archaeon]MCK4955660.1 hypothetical protein [Candidatus Heimdallarchaeota archaeon]